MRWCARIGYYFCLFTLLLLLIFSGLLRSGIKVQAVWKLMEKQRFILKIIYMYLTTHFNVVILVMIQWLKKK